LAPLKHVDAPWRGAPPVKNHSLDYSRLNIQESFVHFFAFSSGVINTSLSLDKYLTNQTEIVLKEL